jgi:hypothetical protein
MLNQHEPDSEFVKSLEWRIDRELRLQKLETDVAKVELDLALVRRQMEQLRIGR